MRQIISNLRTGEISLHEGPAPSVEPNHVLIRTTRTLVSQGTEKMLVQFGKASLFQKARSQPEKVKQVLAKMRTEGVLPTLEAVFRRLDEPLPLGYSNAGVVIGVGSSVIGYSIGDRVASNGPHAEFVSVPVNLVAKIPPGVSDEAAAFTVLSAISLQGIRLARPELGETFVVIGLGLIGQLTAQLLRGAGCRVIGLDFDPGKVELARKLGLEAVASAPDRNPVQHVLRATDGIGADGVIIAASSPSNDVMAHAAQMSRKRGRIVLIGVVGLHLNRADFYEKELTFQVSCSYGPGRYDDAYEKKGSEYPIGFVRWTENRNFQAVLQAMANGVLQVGPLISRRVPLANFDEIYDHLSQGELGSVLEFPCDSVHTTNVALQATSFAPSAGALAIVGAGNFTKMTALPALLRVRAPLKAIVSAGGVTGTALARKYGIAQSGTNFEAVLDDADIRGVIITTRHNLHAAQTVAALKAGKHVLVEKPLCLNLGELAQIEAVIGPSSLIIGPTEDGGRKKDEHMPPTVTVGFNRRFAPYVLKMKELLGDGAGPISIIATMNAGAIPPSHWVHDPDIGGGRLVGEACHFIDLAIHLTGSPIVAVSATALAGASDSASILLRHANGSTAVVNYFAQAHRDLGKERVEVHYIGRSLLLDNFRELHGYGFASFSKLKGKPDKGHTRQFALFAERVRQGGPVLIPWAEIANGARATLAVPQAISERRWIEIG